MIRGTMNALDKSQKVNIELREKPSMTRTQEFDKVLDKVLDKVSELIAGLHAEEFLGVGAGGD